MYLRPLLASARPLRDGLWSFAKGEPDDKLRDELDVDRVEIECRQRAVRNLRVT